MERQNNLIFRNIIKEAVGTSYSHKSQIATKQGVATKTIFLLMLTIIAGFLHFLFGYFFIKDFSIVLTNLLYVKYMKSSMLISSIVITLIVFASVLVRQINKKVISVIYSISEGVLISSFFSLLNIFLLGVFDLLILSVLGTFIIFLIMMFLYYQGFLQVNQKFVVAVSVSSLVLFVFQIIRLILSFWNIHIFGSHSFSELVIAFAMLVLGSCYLAINFAHVETIISLGISKTYEWDLAFGFVTTFIFIFWTIVRILLYFFQESARRK
ncbi:Bax inhibitor-1/YccA family membrane protein [Candidatus Phytoplasma melaleucae]|uniref:Bax inhibitor-1/YccA family protein n=1 Tax=Candidatus Phytoplasma melaleucae TaxID=2982630 RepID=A0ABT9DDQ5_9MOLU|nr:Bax inhibitor-1/YccA family protein ['Melaleuca sp.' phytoplasma]MDO8167974.1 Bax inhibitor-1/YccA family protein ['Melaleuca sp.' phytoplasma]